MFLGQYNQNGHLFASTHKNIYISNKKAITAYHQLLLLCPDDDDGNIQK